jgi:pimeloyl-ACP methyl ester carboxylesterase
MVRLPALLPALPIVLLALLAGTLPARAQTITVGGLTLVRCIKAFDGYCGTLSRPLDPTGRVPGSIDIGFEFYPHTDAGARAGTILAQEGGPGYSTTGSRDGYVRLFTPLRTRRDILLVDKRGSGRSAAIDCRPLQKARDPKPATLRACGVQLGRRAWLYGSDLAADDVAAVLAALGTGRVDYYGDSYATFFGQVFATRHPELLRTVVLDSAYPVLGGTPYFQTEIENGPVAMERVCARSPVCHDAVAAGGPSATDRFAALLATLRANPVSGPAPGANGDMRMVTADPPALFLVIYEVGNNLVAYRDLDAAARALAAGDALPLLRLVAEAEDAAAGGGPADQFSVGLAHAVMCQDYHAVFDLAAPEPQRRRQFAAAIAAKAASDPGLYAPFTLADAMAAPADPEALDSCLAWPAPPPEATPGFPVPRDAHFPDVPVLVLAGELDTVTSPREAKQTTALFPKAWFVVVRNTGHETAVGDGGVFVPPYGGDLARCAGPIVLHFVASGGDPGDTSCATGVRPLRTVPAFATTWRDVPPALTHGDAGADALSLASAAAETVGDAVARYYVTVSGTVAGLRGGRFHLSANERGHTLHLDRLRWAADLAVSGTVVWDQLDGRIEAEVAFTAPGHLGSLTIAWNDRETDAVAHIAGQVDGAKLEAERVAP